MGKKTRVLIAKPGLDPHDRGARILTVALRNAGMEAIYTGLYQTPEAIVNAAIQEDVDFIFLSMLAGAHIPMTERVVELLKENEAENIHVVCGGTIPDRDVPQLKEMGVETFPPMASIGSVIKFLEGIKQNEAFKHS